MTKGLEIRAQIDTEVVKGLLLLNGGGAVALLALLPAVIGKPGFEPLSRAILGGGYWSFSMGLYAPLFIIGFDVYAPLNMNNTITPPLLGKFLVLICNDPVFVF